MKTLALNGIEELEAATEEPGDNSIQVQRCLSLFGQNKPVSTINNLNSKENVTGSSPRFGFKEDISHFASSVPEVNLSGVM